MGGSWFSNYSVYIATTQQSVSKYRTYPTEFTYVQSTRNASREFIYYYRLGTNLRFSRENVHMTYFKTNKINTGDFTAIYYI